MRLKPTHCFLTLGLTLPLAAFVELPFPAWLIPKYDSSFQNTYFLSPNYYLTLFVSLYFILVSLLYHLKYKHYHSNRFSLLSGAHFILTIICLSIILFSPHFYISGHDRFIDFTPSLSTLANIGTLSTWILICIQALFILSLFLVKRTAR